MHILLIHQAFAALDEPGGTRHHEIARILVEKGHQVTVIASPVSYLTGARLSTIESDNIHFWVKKQQENGITILRSYTYPALHKSFIHRVISFFSFMISSFTVGLQVRRVDAVWGTSPPIFQGLTALILAWIKGVPFLFEVRDLWPAFAIQVGVLHNKFLIALSEWLERFLYHQADRILVNSPGFIEHVRQRGALQVELVPNGADPRMFDPLVDGNNFRKKYNLENKYVAMYAGAHGMSNDLGVVLEAAQQLQNRGDIEVVLVGDGKEKNTLQLRAKEMNLANVHFIPAVPKTAIAETLAAADVCIAILKPIPLYATVYPNKVFDYLAAGRPVILAIEGVIQQAVEEAGAGICIPPGNPSALASAICHLADNPDLGKTMGYRGRNYVEVHFDRRILAERVEHIFLGLIELRQRNS